MAFDLAESLQRIGVAQALALELQRQVTAGVGHVGKLLAVGLPVGQAKYIADSVEDYTISAAKLVAHGMPGEFAKVLTKAIAKPPVNTVAPALSGTPTVGQVLTVTNGTWTSPSGTPTYTRKWFRGATQLAATGTTYTLVAADVGFNITVQVEATNANGSSVATSNAIGPVVAE